jgi:hypothetical protein
MRSAWFVALSLLAAVACASGGDGGGLVGDLPGSGTPRGPAKTPADDTDAAASYDSGGGSSNDAAVLPEVASGDDAEEDTGSGFPDATPVDTGTPVPDSSVPDADAGSCGPPVDISSGGTFTVDTCTATSTVAASCGATAPAVILRGDAPASGSTYQITFPSGWVLQMIDGTCAPALDSCGSTGTWSVSGDVAGGYWYFAVEPESGVCGSTTVTVDRIM